MDIHLEVFEGPLDLLIYLIKKNNLDIYDIPIAKITQEYLDYINLMEELNLDLAGEFLVMASTLMQIKIKMLLPKKEDEQEEQKDPRAELVSMLEEYQKYKAASKMLAERFNKYRDVFYRGSPVFSAADKHLDVEMIYLIEAVKRAFGKIEDKAEIEVEDVPIETRIEKIMNMIKEKEWMLLDDVFKDETKKRAIITCFLALLELIRLNKITVLQDENFGEVRIYLVGKNNV
ncbi:MAG: segregation/condensation protein A [Elusimicrobiota bacterium]